MKTQNVLISVWVAGSWLGIASIVPLKAQANPIRRLPPAACAFDFYQSAPSDYHFENAGNIFDFTISPGATGRLQNNSSGIGAKSKQLFCPIVSEISTGVSSTSFGVQRELISGIAIDGFDGNSSTGQSGQSLAHACIWDNVSGYGICSVDQVLSSDTGIGDYSVWLGSIQLSPLKDTSRPFWYGAVVVSIPQQGTAGASSINGIFIGG